MIWLLGKGLITTVLQLKAAYISPVPLANYLDPQIDPKMLWFGSNPGIDIPLGSHGSNEALALAPAAHPQ